jgi:hypothetical protein
MYYRGEVEIGWKRHTRLWVEQEIGRYVFNGSEKSEQDFQKPAPYKFFAPQTRPESDAQVAF